MIMVSEHQLRPDFQLNISYYAPSEMMFSLSVLSNPTQFPIYTKWARRKFHSLSDNLKQEILFFSNNYANWIFITDVILELVKDSMAEEVNVEIIAEDLIKMDNIDFAYLFLGMSAFGYDKNMIRDWIRDPEQVSDALLGNQAKFLQVENVQYFLRHIDFIKHRLANVLTRYWDECFKNEWPAINEYVTGVIEKERILLERSSAMEYIRNLDPRIVIEDGRIILKKSPDFSIEIEKLKKLTLIPSVFIGDNLGANIFEDKLDIILNLNFQSVKLSAPVPQDMVMILSALSDETRLRIIKILWNGESTTTEIAELLDLSPSTVSLHLKILKKASMVETSRVKKYVFYKLPKDFRKNLTNTLFSYFDS